MDLLILGASARAAAHSAARAGLRPAGIDLFADLDLAAVAPWARRVDRRGFPDGLEALAAEAPPAPWIYTGALENHPDLVDRIARDRPLWGNPGPVLRAARDPVRLADALRRAGLPHPEARLDPAGLPRDGSWLVKPLASAGGRRIGPLRADRPIVRGPCYYQERIAGPSLAAIFVASASAAGAGAGVELLGVSRQRIGGPGGDFAYRGSVGPWPLTGPERAGVERLGRAIAAAFGLAGLFGVDLVLKDGLPWPVEVNPRYTASVEVLELALGRPFLVEHVRAFAPDLADGLRPVPPPSSPPGFVGKAYLFAPAPCKFPAASTIRIRPRTGYELPPWADIPATGQDFAAGEPILTLLARSPRLDDCERRLQAGCTRFWRWLDRAGGMMASSPGPVRGPAQREEILTPADGDRAAGGERNRRDGGYSQDRSPEEG